MISAAAADRVVVAGDDVVDLVRVAVGVDEADDRDLELARLLDDDRLLAGVDHEDGGRQAVHAADAAEVLLELAQVGAQLHGLARREQVERAVLGEVDGARACA